MAITTVDHVVAIIVKKKTWTIGIVNYVLICN